MEERELGGPIVLGMALSTYRRQLRSGVDLLTDVLWRWDLYGRGT